MVERMRLGGEDRGRLAVEFGKIARGPHGVHQVIGGIDAVERALNRPRIQQVAGDDLDLIRPGPAADAPRVAHEDTHGMAALQQARDEPPAHIARRPGYQYAHR